MSYDDGRPDPSTCCSNRLLFAVLAEINKAMIDIGAILSSHPEVQKATQGCDIREYYDFMQPEHKVQTFETYVEAETHDGEMFVWAMDLSATVAGWELHRTISKGATGGAQVVTSFLDFTFEKLHELAPKISSMTKEFVDSVNAFNFSHQHPQP